MCLINWLEDNCCAGCLLTNLAFNSAKSSAVVEIGRLPTRPTYDTKWKTLVGMN